MQFRRLTLLYARNASGKTTLARLLAAAGSQDAAAVEAHRTLNAPNPPEVVLLLRDGTCRFDGAGWTGATPRVVVFDRDFIEANVAVGQSPDKATRKGLLELALGADAVASKHALDGFARLGGEIARALAPHAATIRTAAQAAALPEVQFIALPSVEDPVQERQAAEAIERDAISAAEVVKRLRPALLPAVVLPDLDAVAGLLGRTARRLGDEAERQVLDHLKGRLGGRGERWVRDGLSLDDGQTCPFCGQDTRDRDLIRHYRRLFDPAWDQLAASVEAMGRSFDGLESWWSQVAQVGQANRTAFEAWSDLEGLASPQLDSQARRSELDQAMSALRGLFEAKRAHLGDAVDAAEPLSRVAFLLRGIAAHVTAYNDAVLSAQQLIQRRCDALGSLSIEQARKTLRLLDAREQRHSPEVVHALSERVRLEEAKKDNDASKRAAEEALKGQSEATLEAFGKRINLLLEELCADFRLEKLGTERQGGQAAARFTLVVHLDPADHRKLDVAGKDGEQRLARVLSDGDRSTLALAVFLASVGGIADLGQHIVVFDDPMTSLDLRRSEATAEKVADIARRAGQVIALSHHAPFMAQLAHAWSRYGGDGNELREVELDRGTRSIRPWKSEDHVANEQVRRWRELRAFIDDPSLDHQSRHIHGEIRAFLEGYVRLRWPDLFASANQPLEPVVRALQSTPGLREEQTSLTEQQLEALDRLCGFAAPGNHTSVHKMVNPPEPEAVRQRARKALAFCR